MKKFFTYLFVKSVGMRLQLLHFFNKKKAAHIAFDLFCSPRKGRTKSHERDFLSSADSVKIETNGHRIQMYHWEGNGPTIFLLHGWESNSFRWRFLVPLLQEKGYNIIAIDAPGHGSSSGKHLHVPLYTKCIKDIAKIYQPEIFIGHSLGAMSSVYYHYLENTSHLKKIVALGPPSELPLFLKNFQSILGLSDNLMRSMDDYIYELFGFYSKDFSIANFAKKLELEGLLILDKNDPLAPYKLSLRIAKNWKNCELFTVEGVGHSLQSEAINQKIIQSLSSI